MADAAMEFIFSVVNGVFWVGLLLGPPAVYFMFRHRFPIMPGRIVFSAFVYQLKEGRTRDATGHVKDDDIEFKRELRCWRHSDKKIPYCWVETGFMQGFDYDAAAFIVMRTMGKKSGVVRFLELTPNTNAKDNFALIDVPLAMDESKVRTGISSNAKTALESIRTEGSRASSMNLLQVLGPPVIGIIALIVIVILALQWATSYTQNITNASVDHITSTMTTSTRQIVYACGGQFYEPPVNNTTGATQPRGTVIPFIGGG